MQHLTLSVWERAMYIAARGQPKPTRVLTIHKLKDWPASPDHAVPTKVATSATEESPPGPIVRTDSKNCENSREVNSLAGVLPTVKSEMDDLITIIKEKSMNMKIGIQLKFKWGLNASCE